MQDSQKKEPHIGESTTQRRRVTLIFPPGWSDPRAAAQAGLRARARAAAPGLPQESYGNYVHLHTTKREKKVVTFSNSGRGGKKLSAVVCFPSPSLSSHNRHHFIRHGSFTSHRRENKPALYFNVFRLGSVSVGKYSTTRFAVSLTFERSRATRRSSCAFSSSMCLMSFLISAVENPLLRNASVSLCTALKVSTSSRYY